jgi:hypothetical protein
LVEEAGAFFSDEELGEKQAFILQPGYKKPVGITTCWNHRIYVLDKQGTLHSRNIHDIKCVKWKRENDTGLMNAIAILCEDGIFWAISDNKLISFGLHNIFYSTILNFKASSICSFKKQILLLSTTSQLYKLENQVICTVLDFGADMGLLNVRSSNERIHLHSKKVIVEFSGMGITAIAETEMDINDLLITQNRVLVLTDDFLYSLDNRGLIPLTSSIPNQDCKFGSLKKINLRSFRVHRIFNFQDSLLLFSEAEVFIISDLYCFYEFSKIIVNLCKVGGIGFAKADHYLPSATVAEAQPHIERASQYFSEDEQGGQGEKGKFSVIVRKSLHTLNEVSLKFVQMDLGSTPLSCFFTFNMEETFGILRSGCGSDCHPNLLGLSQRIATLQSIKSVELARPKTQYQPGEQSAILCTVKQKKEKRTVTPEEIKELYMISSLMKERRSSGPTSWCKQGGKIVIN